MIRLYLAAALSAMIVGSVGVADCQTRVSGATTVTPIAWAPIAVMPAPVSIGATERIAIKELHGYAAVGRVNGVWHRWSLSQFCVTVQAGWNCPPGLHKSPNSRCCRWNVSDKTQYAPNADVRALVDVAGTNPSQIFVLQDIGTLPAPVSSGATVQTSMQLGQTLALINNRTLTVVKDGWAGLDYVLQSGGQTIDRWSTYDAVIITDQSQRVAILRKIGTHRADNWGIPASTLGSAQ